MERSRIGRDCNITESVIGQSVIIEGNVTVKGSIIGPGCVIGENAEILEGSRIWPNVRIEAGARVSETVLAPVENALYFHTDSGQYTGLMATSIDGFIDALEKAPIESIEFHIRRRDYERWARDVLDSNDLANNIEEIRKSDLTGEELRRGLMRATAWAHPEYAGLMRPMVPK
jgi:carbonic anhydrase/acetyltransferase-like protein (isoleucine patch superfamily)